MAVRAYVLIESAVGSARAVYKGAHRLAVADAKVLSADTVTGPFDVIALVESPDLDRLGRLARCACHRALGRQLRPHPCRHTRPDERGDSEDSRS
jgi:hypothetical protein